MTTEKSPKEERDKLREAILRWIAIRMPEAPTLEQLSAEQRIVAESTAAQMETWAMANGVSLDQYHWEFKPGEVCN
jgi:hypothetical protein